MIKGRDMYVTNAQGHITKLKHNKPLYMGMSVYVPREFVEPIGDFRREDLNLRDWIIYKDTDFLVLNKPPGLAIHGGTDMGVCLMDEVHQLRFSCDEDPIWVNQLPAAMSGILIFARHQACATLVRDSVKKRVFSDKIYWALVCGEPTSLHGNVNIPLQLQRGKWQQPCSTTDGGVHAITEWRVAKTSSVTGGVSLLEMMPQTTTRHQVRAHAAYGLKCPIIGDSVYYEPAQKLGRLTGHQALYAAPEAIAERNKLFGEDPPLMLHSRSVVLRTFAGKQVRVDAPPPKPMLRAFARLGWAHDVSWTPQRELPRDEPLAWPVMATKEKKKPAESEEAQTARVDSASIDDDAEPVDELDAKRHTDAPEGDEDAGPQPVSVTNNFVARFQDREESLAAAPPRGAGRRSRRAPLTVEERRKALFDSLGGLDHAPEEREDVDLFKRQN